MKRKEKRSKKRSQKRKINKQKGGTGVNKETDDVISRATADAGRLSPINTTSQSPKAIIDSQPNLSVQEESEEVKKSINYLIGNVRELISQLILTLYATDDILDNQFGRMKYNSYRNFHKVVCEKGTQWSKTEDEFLNNMRKSICGNFKINDFKELFTFIKINTLDLKTSLELLKKISALIDFNLLKNIALSIIYLGYILNNKFYNDLLEKWKKNLFKKYNEIPGLNDSKLLSQQLDAFLIGQGASRSQLIGNEILKYSKKLDLEPEIINILFTLQFKFKLMGTFANTFYNTRNDAYLNKKEYSDSKNIHILKIKQNAVNKSFEYFDTLGYNKLNITNEDAVAVELDKYNLWLKENFFCFSKYLKICENEKTLRKGVEQYIKLFLN